MTETDIGPENIDSEDMQELLFKVEKSFDIKFGDTELLDISTFGELCDHITTKIELDNSGDCTSQQAFYKLRNSIQATLQVQNKTITPDTLLFDLLPRRGRLSATKKTEKHLGFKLSILRPPHFVTGILAIILVASFFGIFFNWELGLIGLLFAFGGLWFANKIGKELKLETVGQVAEQMTHENYIKSRRNQKTFNNAEIEKILTDWFSKELGLDKSKLTRQAKFV